MRRAVVLCRGASTVATQGPGQRAQPATHSLQPKSGAARARVIYILGVPRYRYGTVWDSRAYCGEIFCRALPPGAGTAAQPGPSRPTCVPGGPSAPPRHARGETAREASTRQRGTRADAAGRGVMTSQSEFPLILRIDSAFLHACKNSESDGPTWAHSRGGGCCKVRCQGEGCAPS